ncbi:MAG: hypothetical protein IKQ43_04210 [Treponema sp.]|nr:hypothetical protein [Treponema sp.]
MKKIVVFPFLILMAFMLMSCQTTGNNASAKSTGFKKGEIVNGKDGKPVLYRNQTIDIAIDISSTAVVLPPESLSALTADAKNVDFVMSHLDSTGATVMVSVENLGQELVEMDDRMVTELLMESPMFVGTISDQLKQSLESRGYTVNDVYVDELEFMGETVLAFRLEGALGEMHIDYLVIFTKVGQYLRGVIVGATKYEYCLEQVAKIGHYR